MRRARQFLFGDARPLGMNDRGRHAGCRSVIVPVLSSSSSVSTVAGRFHRTAGGGDHV